MSIRRLVGTAAAMAVAAVALRSVTPDLAAVTAAGLVFAFTMASMATSDLIAIGQGAKEPKNASDPFSPENRRVEIVLSNDNAPIPPRAAQR